MAKRVIRLTETDMNKIVREAVKNYLKEDTKPRTRKMLVKCVECYDGDDTVFVAAITQNGSDNEAVRNVKKRFPNLEVVDVNDVDGFLDLGDMGPGAYRLFEDGAIILGDDCIQSVDDLEWVNESKNGDKDPMKQWFKDMDRAQKFRDTMDYVTKGGRNPNKRQEKLDEEVVGSGNDFNAVNKWVFWCFNWEPIENYAHIFKGAPKEHFIDKFNGCRGDMNRFYTELDSTNRPILVDYVMNNFRG